MTRRLVLLCLLVAGASTVHAQQASSSLTEQQRTGRRLFFQKCAACHVQGENGGRTYGPVLQQRSGGGNDEILRKFILDGSPRMPAFRHALSTQDINAVIAYIKTVAPAAPAPAAR